jgi:branched-chain amino acid aminotransferase
MAELIPFDDRDGFIWFNGNIIPWREAKIHVISHGLHYGSAVFEGERAYNGNIFKSAEHTARFIKSAALIDMPFPYTAEEIERAKIEVLKKNNLTDAYLRPLAWRGSEQMGIGAPKTKTHVMIAAWTWPSYFSAEMRESGISLMTSKWRKPSPETAPITSKASGLYIINTMSKHAAENAGFHDALMLDYRGYAVESTGANLFIVKDGIVQTPKPDCFLNGITRLTILELCQQHDIKYVEDHISVDLLKSADEVFLTGTAAEIVAVGRIDDTRYKVGDVTRFLRAQYETLVRL